MKYALFICSLFLPSCQLPAKKPAHNILKGEEYAIFYNNEEITVCSVAQRSSCGIRLSSCNDKLKYECVPSVIILNLKDFKDIYKKEL